METQTINVIIFKYINFKNEVCTVTFALFVSYYLAYCYHYGGIIKQIMTNL